ncbi:hydroxyacylglutathione hydrolase [Sporosarcina sp. PTS2304]|uniref:hydroxyacylglutathione hydrolase n=1 Tax=Sporosarcina sp. PTS2304 TaxID=2283194 RepID=UPI000E0D2380|nr:hydroxyacylglutathione hydrolase [Sporosarcina sp. PTS2304]AXH99235.1 hydroxyacylglutathione hydrolase [Sporosarcina sp. PTS2304]
MNVHPIKAFSDNYIWCMEEGTDAVLVDPGTASGVLDYLRKNNLQLHAILLTHAHEDHVGGVADIVAEYSDVTVYGPQETSAFTTHVIAEGDRFMLLGQSVDVLETAGHTNGHISYVIGDHLFCGDALFSAGCGRVFTGDYEAQYRALQKFKHLADHINVYAGHEYTETNLRFACDQQESTILSDALQEVRELRAKDQPTLPSTIGREKSINLFLQVDTLEDFIALRNARDCF